MAPSLTLPVLQQEDTRGMCNSVAHFTFGSQMCIQKLMNHNMKQHNDINAAM